MTKDDKPTICAWIGDGEYCRHPTIYGKYYCENHYERVYLTMPPEMANYIINKELDNEQQ